MEKKGLILASPASKPKTFSIVNPKKSIADIIDERSKALHETIDKLDEAIRIKHEVRGRCAKDVSFYHYSDIDLAIGKIIALIEAAKKEIVMSAIPPSMIRRIEPSLRKAFLKGLPITLYFSLLDYEEVPDYLDQILNTVKKIRISIVETKERTSQSILYNDAIVNLGDLLVDGANLCAIVFHDDRVYHVNGFYGPLYVSQAKKLLEVKTVLKNIKEDPEPIRAVIEAIDSHGGEAKTRDIGNASGLSGENLRKVLDYLLQQGTIKEEIIQGNGAGRPKKVYYLDDNTSDI